MSAPADTVTVTDVVARAWRATLRERLAQRRDEVLGDLLVRRACRPGLRIEPTARRSSTGVALATTSSTWLRRPGLSSGRASRLKIDERIDLIVSSMSATARCRRSSISDAPRRLVASSDRPTANRRWMTVSCRSRAMRSRSDDDVQLLDFVAGHARARTTRPLAGRMPGAGRLRGSGAARGPVAIMMPITPKVSAPASSGTKRPDPNPAAVQLAWHAEVGLEVRHELGPFRCGPRHR